METLNLTVGLASKIINLNIYIFYTTFTYYSSWITTLWELKVLNEALQNWVLDKTSFFPCLYQTVHFNLNC